MSCRHDRCLTAALVLGKRRPRRYLLSLCVACKRIIGKSIALPRGVVEVPR